MENKMVDVEDTIERIKQHKGVEGVIVAKLDGVPVRGSKGLDEELLHQYSQQVSMLLTQTRAVIKDLDNTDDLTFLRMRTQKHELLIAPGGEFVLVVIQDPSQKK